MATAKLKAVPAIPPLEIDMDEEMVLHTSSTFISNLNYLFLERRDSLELDTVDIAALLYPLECILGAAEKRFNARGGAS